MSKNDEGPWGATPLPLPVTHFDCPGDAWHDDPRVFPSKLVCAKGVPGTPCPEDGFYCGVCIYDLEKRGGVPIMTGPMLAEEMDRRMNGN